MKACHAVLHLAHTSENFAHAIFNNCVHLQLFNILEDEVDGSVRDESDGIVISGLHDA